MNRQSASAVLRKNSLTLRKSRRLLICCSGGRCFSPPPGAVPLRLPVRRLSLNCGISTSFRRGFRSGLGRVITDILWPAIGWRTKGWWPHRLLCNGCEPVCRNPESVKSDVKLPFKVILFSGRTYDVVRMLVY